MYNYDKCSGCGYLKSFCECSKSSTFGTTKISSGYKSPVFGKPMSEIRPFMPLANPMVPSKPVALICNQQLPPALFKN